MGITYRLFLAVLAATALAVVCMFFVARWSIERGFLQYVNNLDQARIARLTVSVQDVYSEHGDWNFLRQDPTQWHRLIVSSVPEESAMTPRSAQNAPLSGRFAGEEGHSSSGHPRAFLSRRFERRVLLLDIHQKPIVSPDEVPGHFELTPLRHKDVVVGYLGLVPLSEVVETHQVRFLKEQKLTLALVAGAAVILAAAFSLPLARRLVQPIKNLAQASRRLADGHYDTRVSSVSHDELGQLTRDFNALALTLEKNEQARRQWVADISHELRTPLSVLRGEIEAILDGVREPSVDSVRSLHSEVLRLGRLIDDLYQLSLADLGALTYRKEDVNLVDLVSGAIASFRTEFSQKGITVTADLPVGSAPTVFADPERLRQLFCNVLDNTLKYTDMGGQLSVRLRCLGAEVTVDLQDSAPSVPEGDMERLFDRLYRVEDSRNRSGGGAGLGLAICKSIVEAHAGTISALPSPRGGVWIKVVLPLAGC